MICKVNACGGVKVGGCALSKMAKLVRWLHSQTVMAGVERSLLTWQPSSDHCPSKSTAPLRWLCVWVCEWECERVCVCVCVRKRGGNYLFCKLQTVQLILTSLVAHLVTFHCHVVLPSPATMTIHALFKEVQCNTTNYETVLRSTLHTM